MPASKDDKCGGAIGNQQEILLSDNIWPSDQMIGNGNQLALYVVSAQTTTWTIIATAF